MSTTTKAVVLNGSLTASRARISPEVKRILTSVLKDATVTLHEKHYYRVDFGADVQPQHHIVSHDLFCTCGLEQDCAAVTAVKKHLSDGGETAIPPEPGFYPVAPHVCPVCGGKVQADARLSSRHRGMGWRCEKGGAGCYWTAHCNALKARCAEKNARPGAIQVVSIGDNPFPFSAGYDPYRVYMSSGE